MAIVNGHLQDLNTISEDTSPTKAPRPSPLFHTPTHKIPYRSLRQFSSTGSIASGTDASRHPYNTEQTLRPVAWRLLLNYIPPNIAGWKPALDTARGSYWGFVQEFVTKNEALSSTDLELLTATDASDEMGSIQDIINKTILDTADSSSDLYLLHEILKDVHRTFPDLSFYIAPPTSLPRLLSLTRILFVWSKLNQGVRYVQGMNEIVGVVYYVLGCCYESETSRTGLDAITDPTCTVSRVERNEQIEADAYHLTSTLLTSLVDIFTPSLDDDETGIAGRINEITMLVEMHDPILAEHFRELQIEGQFYCMRWVTTLLSREFHLPDTVRLWDSMFSSVSRDNFLKYTCATMVILIRDQLLESDFAGCLSILQNYPNVDVDMLIASTKALYVFENTVQQLMREQDFRLTKAMVNTDPGRHVIMAFGFRGGVVTDDLVESLRETGAVLKGGAVHAAKDVGEGAKSIWNWGKKAVKELQEKSAQAAEVRKGKERERMARETMEQMRIKNAEATLRSKQQEAFIRQQKEIAEQDLNSILNSNNGGEESGEVIAEEKGGGGAAGE